eukprot:CAMPEP_0115004240 /NCGR_PEP_ID=MMETSP0216-20121206/19079_1 /TAXON_ID=223996 /ORGANISM="Protocruzia adherens, Strain Boccale" /LENGTH=269 /DNA_ID=CAMNT_0002370179 /DNA_START=133 /DNA_END=939 /DNA_ORIENTATION=+
MESKEGSGEQNKTEQELREFLQTVRSMSKTDDHIMTTEAQIERLTSKSFLNPYEVLMSPPESTDEELKKRYRSLSLLVHPDKARHDKAHDAFTVVEQAYKKLQNPDQKQVFQRIIREARDRVEHERRKDNKKRVKSGLKPLPEETIQSEIELKIQELFEEIEEKKEHFEKTEQSRKRRKREEEDLVKKEAEEQRNTDEAWEKNRNKRVQNWREFSSAKKKGKSLTGKSLKRQKIELRAPKTRAEERTENAPKTEGFKPLGINEDYKKYW